MMTKKEGRIFSLLRGSDKIAVCTREAHVTQCNKSWSKESITRILLIGEKRAERGERDLSDDQEDVPVSQSEESQDRLD